MELGSIDLAAIASGAAGTVQRKAKQGVSIPADITRAVLLWLTLPPVPVMGEKNEGQTRAIPASLVPDTSRGGVQDLAKAVSKAHGAGFGHAGAMFAWCSNYTANTEKHPEQDGTVRFGLRLFVPASATTAKVKDAVVDASVLPADAEAWKGMLAQESQAVQDRVAAAIAEAQEGRYAVQTNA